MAMAFSVTTRGSLSIPGFSQFKHNVSSSSSSRLIVSSLPFQGSPYQREIEAAISVVERACTLCTNVRTMMTIKGREQMDKSDQTPVTIADFSVQSLISMELGLLFPSIPLVAEEDASFLRTEDDDTETVSTSKTNLLDQVVAAVSEVSSMVPQSVNRSTVLEAIDRGGQFSSHLQMKNGTQTYWVLDPIDGTRGFLKGGDALYVIGLALVVEGKLVLGIMGCPALKDENMRLSSSGKCLIESLNNTIVQNKMPDRSIDGVLVAAHHGYGSWVKFLQDGHKESNGLSYAHHFVRCWVDGSVALKNACIGLSDHECWETSPLAGFLDSDKERQDVVTAKICCGSLCKYLSVAIGAVSVVLIPQTRSTVKAWDHAAGVICVVEAGGRVTDADGLDLECLLCNGDRSFLPGGRKMIVTNGNLHDTVLKGLSKIDSN